MAVAALTSVLLSMGLMPSRVGVTGLMRPLSSNVSLSTHTSR